MRSYKSIERPAQVLGMSLRELGLGFLTLITLAMLIGIMGTFMTVPRQAYLVLLVLFAVLIYGLRYLGKHHPPNFLLGFLSFHMKQPRRIALGPSSLPPLPHGRAKK
jgi:type IV secretory pathway VirB3-like protein